jgi:hypothetical protein
LQLSKQTALVPELFSVVPSVFLTRGEAFWLQAQSALSPAALLAWIPLGSLWKHNQPLLSPSDHSHWAQKLSLVQALPALFAVCAETGRKSAERKVAVKASQCWLVSSCLRLVGAVQGIKAIGMLLLKACECSFVQRGHSPGFCGSIEAAN